MKRFLICILLLVILSACAESSSAGSYRCDKKWGLCISATAEGPILPGKPIIVTTRITSKKDIQDMVVALYFAPAVNNLAVEAVVSVEGTKKQVAEIKNLTVQSGDVGGVISIQANQPLSITWQLLAPKWEGFSSLSAMVFTPSGSPVTAGSINFYFTNEGGQVYYAGTRIPVTNPPLIETMYFYTYTPGPSPTWAPSATLYPQIATEVALTQQAATPPPPSP